MSLEGDHNILESITRVIPYIVCNLGDVRIVERSVDFVQNNKRRESIAVGLFEPRVKVLRASRAPLDSEKKSQCCDRPLSWSISRNRFIGGIVW